MKLSLIDRNMVPPNGFRYVDPVDGWVDHSWDYNSWVDQAKRHLQVNEREIPVSLEADMEDQLCQTLEPGWCNYDSDSRPRVSTSLGWSDVMNGLTTFKHWVTSGMAYVSQGEADRRAQICAKCYLNTTVSGCASCQKLVEEVVRNKKTGYDSYLKTCAVCKCFLRAMVHFRVEDLEKSKGQKEIYLQVPHCWLNPESKNYRG